MTDEELAAIARGLSEAQREAVLALSAEWQAGPHLDEAICDELKGLRERHLVERYFKDMAPTEVVRGEHSICFGVAACWHFRLSETGLALRAHLEKAHG